MIAALLLMLGYLTAGMVMDAFSDSEESSTSEPEAEEAQRPEENLLDDINMQETLAEPVPSQAEVPVIPDFVAGEDVLVVLLDDDADAETQEIELRQTQTLTELWLNGAVIAAVDANAGLDPADVFMGRAG